MKYAVLLLAVSCSLSAVHAVWLETEIHLPDSLCGTTAATLVACDTADNRILVAGGTVSDDWVIVIDASTNAKIGRVHVPDGVHDMVYVPELGRVYCSSTIRRIVYVIDPVGCVVEDSIIPLNRVDSMEYNPPANKLYCAYEGEHAIRTIDCALGSPQSYIGLYASPGPMCWAQSLDKLYCLLPDSGTIAVIDCASDSLLGYIRVGPDACCLLYNPQSERLYCSVRGIDSLAIIDPVGDSLIRLVSAVHKPKRLGLNPVLNHVYCSSNLQGQVTVVDGQGDSVLGTMALPNAVSSFTYDPLVSMVLALDVENWLRIIDCRDDGYVDSMYVGPATDVRYDPRRRLLYSAGGRFMSVLDVATRTPAAKVVLGIRPSGVCWCPEGNKLYCATGVTFDSGVATVAIDCESNRVVASVPTPEAPNMLLYHSLRNKLYVANGGYQEKTLTVVDCRSDTVMAREYAGDDIYCMCYSRATDELYAGNGPFDFHVYAVDCETDKVVALVMPRLYPMDLAAAGKQNAVYVACWIEGYVQAIDCVTHQIFADIPTPGAPYALQYWPDEDLMFVARKDSDRVSVIDCQQNEVTADIPVGNGPIDLELAHDFGEVYCANSLGHDVTVISCSTLSPVATIDVRGSPTLLMYDSIAGKIYCVCRGQSVVSVVDCRDHSLVSTTKVGDYAGFAAWSPASRRFYTSNSWSSNLSVIRDTAVAGAAESGTAIPGLREPHATMVRGMLMFGPANGAGRGVPGELLDVSGRKVLMLSPGANDIRALAPGVYFVRDEGRGARDAGRIRKIVITR